MAALATILFILALIWGMLIFAGLLGGHFVEAKTSAVIGIFMSEVILLMAAVTAEFFYLVDMLSRAPCT